MQRTRQNDENDAVYPFEMGMIDEKSSKSNFENARDSRRTTDRKTVLDTVPENDVGVLLENELPCPVVLTDEVDNRNEEPPETQQKNATQLATEGNRLRFEMWNGFFDRLRRARRKRFQSSVKPNNGGVHKNVYLNDKKEYSQNMPMDHELPNNQENVQSNITPGTQGRCCFLRQFISIILVVIFIMSATSLTLAIMIINGSMAASEETATGSPKGILMLMKLF